MVEGGAKRNDDGRGRTSLDATDEVSGPATSSSSGSSGTSVTERGARERGGEQCRWQIAAGNGRKLKLRRPPRAR